jgi:hypothetical protein
MAQPDLRSRFDARLLRPAKPGAGAPWDFVVLPAETSAKLPRQGRTTVDGSINGQPFRCTLEPDGQLSHWLKVDEALLNAAGADFDEIAEFERVTTARP